jgi:hypothetical protein
MNRSRLAAVLHELVDVIVSDYTLLPVESPRPRSPRTPVRPAGESDELARAAARRALRDHGFMKVRS